MPVLGCAAKCFVSSYEMLTVTYFAGSRTRLSPWFLQTKLPSLATIGFFLVYTLYNWHANCIHAIAQIEHITFLYKIYTAGITNHEYSNCHGCLN